MSDHHHDDDRLDRGLGFDIGTLGRRRALLLLAGAGAGVALAACGGGDGTSASGSSTTASTTTGSTTTTAASGGPGGGGPGGGPPDGGPGGGVGGAETASSDDPDAIPNETAGPYPGDGSNGPDVLLESGIVRSDITTSLGTSTVAGGVPLAITLTVTDSDTGDPLPGHAVYLWHCDREGRYSMYSDGVEDETYLRGVQEADADGRLTFATVVPGCYDGRWPHVHFEVYEGLAVATSSGAIVATSQLALPQDVCEAAYATDGYEASVENLSRVTLASDGIFSDGYDAQLAATTGSVGRGYTATLTVPVTAG